MKLVREDRQAGVALLRLDGQLIGGPETGLITDAVNGAIEDGRRQIILDLGNVPWMSSGGVGVLVRVHATLKRHDGRLILLRASERIKRILVVTGLLVILESFDHEDEALASCAV